MIGFVASFVIVFIILLGRPMIFAIRVFAAAIPKRGAALRARLRIIRATADITHLQFLLFNVIVHKIRVFAHIAACG